MKKILGLDLGTNSIGWALVEEAEKENEKSSITKIGSRIIHYGDNLVKVDKKGKISASMTPEEDFSSGKGLSPNAGRTKQRSARRNLQRYKLRRANLIEILKEHSIIPNDFIFSEEGNSTTFKTYKNRALAATEEIPIEEFVRILFMINKKRGYKSSRKAKGEEDGQLIDGMTIAKLLYENNQTPGQFVYELLKNGKKHVPDFYRSDLQMEFDKIWHFQKLYNAAIFTNETYEKIKGQKKNATKDYFEKVLKIDTPELKGKLDEKKLQHYELRSKAVKQQLNIGEVADTLIEINSEINNSSGYLGAISDRSKELYFQKITVGQYLFKQINDWQNAYELAKKEKINCPPAISLKKQIFYRQDYMDEFNTIWDTQAKYHKELSTELKSEIRDVIIFYQRRLKSQKGLISFCEFESKQIEVIVDGKKKIKTRGLKVIPKSSPLFQEFKIWQILNNIEVTNTKTKEVRELVEDEKQLLFEELNIKTKISKKEALNLLFDKSKEYDLNYKDIEGNKTNAVLYEAYQKIIALSGHDEKDFTKIQSKEAKEYVKQIFNTLGIKTEILDFDSSIEGNAIEKQLHFQLWHLLYSYEGDKSQTGNDKLFQILKNKFGFEKEYAQIIANVALLNDYGSLSAKAIRKILPHLKDGFSYGGRKDRPNEPSACEYAGYKHSKSSLTREEKENKVYKNKLNELPKNSLRNPIVEKILNQMVNVVNAAIEEYGKPDEIRLELARELKKSAEERKEMSEAISKSTSEHEKYRKILQTEFGLKQVSRNDLIRYKLYLELKRLGFKTLYSNTYIAPNELFSKKFDIEHILPKAKIYDDSFSNKTLELKSINIEKGDMTAYDFVKEKYGNVELLNYEKRVEDLYFSKRITEEISQENNQTESKTGDLRISKTKRDKLLMPESKIPSGFIERELRNTQYIAKKAKEMMEEICKEVTTTTGSVTDRLREDWQLIDIMQELNWNKYNALGLTEEFTNKDGNVIKRIKDWTKRNDHRNHAMDAITVAFTKRSHVQYLNNLNARNDKSSSIYGIEQKELYRDKNNKLRFKPPIPLNDFRAEAKKQLENTLISFKANNKVITKNKNKFKIKGGEKTKIELTPRGQLHLETVYGSIKRYKTEEVKVSGTLNLETINKVSKKNIREALLKRLAEFDNNPKKAFTGKNSPEKNPVYLDEHQSYKVPDKVKIVLQETIYTIRKDVTPDLFKDSKKNDDFENRLKNIYDKSVQEALMKHYNMVKKEVEIFNTTVEKEKDKKKVLDVAFSNLTEKPIWLNKEKGISIKRITFSGISNAVSLRNKKDHNGKFLLDKNKNKIAVDFVTTGNNHHVALYKDGDGNLQDNVISFYEAVERVNQGLPIIDKEFKQAEGWQFLFTMKQNECFVFPNEKTGFDPKEIDLLNPENYYLISPNLFIVQTMSKVAYGNNIIRDYKFRHHLETTKNDRKELKDITYKQYKTLAEFKNIVKVRINHLGKIVKIGEY
jgi:CRISPR-associated endonuclease Csn1